MLPQDQQPIILDGDTPARDAIERMIDNNFSQIPVTEKNGKIIGVFTWKSFSRRALDLHSAKMNSTDLPIREAMEPPNFINPEFYIDTETDWGNLDYVLVGTADKLIGILCVSDVFGRLNDFAEAFVLLYEIELEIRDLIRNVFNEEELTKALNSMTESANHEAKEVVESLKILNKEKMNNKKYIGKAIKLLNSSGTTKLEGLKDFTFSQYSSFIFREDNWEKFEPIFKTKREILIIDFDAIRDLRNTVFHFRRSINPTDTDRLRRFRDRLRYDRELFLRRAQKENNKPNVVTT